MSAISVSNSSVQTTAGGLPRAGTRQDVTACGGGLLVLLGGEANKSPTHPISGRGLHPWPPPRFQQFYSPWYWKMGAPERLPRAVEPIAVMSRQCLKVMAPGALELRDCAHMCICAHTAASCGAARLRMPCCLLSPLSFVCACALHSCSRR